MNDVERFLWDVASAYAQPQPLTLRIIGSTALILRTGYVRGTTDSDVLETVELDGATRTHLIELGGVGSKLAKRYGLHLQFVRSGIPLLPHPPKWHPIRLGGERRSLSFEALDVVDVVVSKIKRFAPKDRSDIEAMIDLGRVPHERLVERFLSAIGELRYDARAEDLPICVKRFHEIERELFGVEPTDLAALEGDD